MRMHVLIAGGGIGGLTLALMLQQRGIACTVLEAAPEVRELGVGINNLPHCVAEWEALGLLPELDRIAIRTRELRYLNHLGQTLWQEARGTYAGHALPQFSTHRGRLHGMLWRAVEARLPAGALRTGHRLAAVEQDAAGVTARFATGTGHETLRGEVLVGADGIHSALRAMLHPADAGIRWQGVMMWRGALDWPAYETGDVMFIAGDLKTKFVFYPVGPGSRPDRRLTNWVVYSRLATGERPPPQREDWSRPGRLEDVLPLAQRLKLPFLDVEALVRASPQRLEYPMCDRDPLPWWSEGRVTLLGDAAHAMYPVGSNGASQAVLDARALADALAAQPAEQALKAYEAERLPKTAAICASNRKGGPERVIDVFGELAPDGFGRIEEVIPPEDVAAIVRGYAQLAGFALPL
ncbi:flavin-dependent oxidoreductase [Roseicella sp. DB1501]|uniref:flavin-dependent oxidoreductase n=1 Tax=Roseicella sp. DB1501 TaxID=2730925 RepID=UPI0020C3DD71|nr:flavin-dependent oxidoreductase [Roseicella sp. DB1501]